MSDPRLFVSGFPLQLRLREVQTSFIGWGIYMASLVFYCLIHEIVVSTGVLDLQEIIIWPIREWGIWLFITPITFKILRQHGAITPQRVFFYLKLAAGVLLVSLSFRVGIDYFTTTRGIAPSIVIFFPRHLAAFAVVILIWHLLLRTKPLINNLPPANDSDNRDGIRNAEYPRTILVSKGNDECLIRIDQIQCISAAGNYVEIYCNNGLYLMRATMKQVEDLLPPALFLRTHRSHIININEIDRIKTRPSGNGAVQLRCGKILSISKKYKSQLQKYRLQAA
jgi:hypothetical protein